MKILVVDDEQAVRESLKRSLRFNGYDVEQAEDGEKALEAIAIHRPDLVILDVMMPKLDGLGVCRILREQGDHTPVLMLTARDDVADRVGGLDAGADDYLPKPFALEELMARIRSLLRRTREKPTSEDSIEQATMQFDDLTLNTETREVFRGQRPITLTRTEFALLLLLMKNARGAQRLMDTAGRVEKFNQRFGGMARRKKKSAE